MAFLEINLYSNSLMRTTTVNVVIPTDKRTALGQTDAPAQFPTLYLLHGILGNYTDWVNGTTLQALADVYNLCVVMPSGDNKFYCDSTKTGDMYGKFIGEELVSFIQKTFPVSKAREDTYIAGLSMGGFGAIVNGLRKPDTFGYIGAFSAALIKENILKAVNEGSQDLCTKKQYETMFDLDDVKDFPGSVNDYDYLARKLKEDGKDLPKIWMACGTEDGLHKSDEQFASLLNELGYDVTWLDWGGKHDWKFWQECIEKFIPWLPLEIGQAGISSGNVGKAE